MYTIGLRCSYSLVVDGDNLMFLVYNGLCKGGIGVLFVRYGDRVRHPSAGTKGYYLAVGLYVFVVAQVLVVLHGLPRQLLPSLSIFCFRFPQGDRRTLPILHVQRRANVP